MPSPPACPLVLLSALCLSAPALEQEIATTTGLPFDVASVKASSRPEPNPFGFPVGAIPIYHLVTARRDGTLGPQLKTSSIDCASIQSQRGPGAPAADPSEPSCQVSFKVASGSMTIAFQGETSSELARRIVPERDRPVIDSTGLAGTFDGTLTFAPEPPPGFPRLPGSENGVSVFTALQEQWGLKLEPTRGPVEILVIDGVEKPTEN